MAIHPLINLHNQFVRCINGKTYLSANEANEVEETQQKNDRLKDIYAIAKKQIESILEDSENQTITDEKKISHLKKLEQDGDIIYTGYEKKTKSSWRRWFLKVLAKCTPALLAPFLPSCFSNQIAQAEIDTKAAFDAFSKFLTDKIEEISLPLEGEPEDLPERQRAQPQTSDTKTPNGEDKLKTPTKKPVLSTKRPPLDAEAQKMIDARLKLFGEGTKKDPALELALRASLESQIPDEDEDEEYQKAIRMSLAPPNESEYDDTGEFINALIPNAIRMRGIPQQPTTPTSPLVPPKDDFFDNPQGFLDSPEFSRAPSPAPSPKAAATHPKKEIAAGPKDLLQHQTNAVQALGALEASAKQTLTVEKYKYWLDLAVKSMTALKNDGGTEKLKGLNDDTAGIDLLDLPALKTALATRDLTDLLFDQDALLRLLTPIPSWHSGYKKAIAADKISPIPFAMRKLPGSKDLVVHNEQRLSTYKGRINLPLELAPQFSAFVKKYPECRPYSITVTIDNNKMSSDLVKELLALSDLLPEIIILNLSYINFETLGASKGEEERLIQKLHARSIELPNIQGFSLGGSPKEWSIASYNQLLAFLPTTNLLDQYCLMLLSWEGLELPASLKEQEPLRISRDYSQHQISYLLRECTQFKTFHLVGDTKITDSQFMQWIAASETLKNIKALYIDQCGLLTTDLLAPLMQLPNLKGGALPDLPPGTKPLNELPKSADPFKIALLYTTSGCTKELAAGLYEGPQIRSFLFQTPLARNGAKNVFLASQTRIDPQSVAYWLNNDAYTDLRPQPSVTTIIADDNINLNGDNLAEFAKKFPNLTEISLYNCSNVTNEAVLRLLKECPGITKIDLTSCQGITDALFLEGEFAICFANVQQVTLTDTGISPAVAILCGEAVGKHVVEYSNAVLNVTDDQLTDENALEDILNELSLFDLKRIDLRDCTQLTDAMLSKLLDRLNTDAVFIQADGTTRVKNKQRLDITRLNLTGCSQITDAAFTEEGIEGKKNTKILGTLSHVIIGEEHSLSRALIASYPKILFQKADESTTTTNLTEEQFINPSFIQLSLQTLDGTEQAQLKVPKETLYTTSILLRNHLRPGGESYKKDSMTLINQHLTLETCLALGELFNGNEKIIRDLTWETASHLAEIVGLNNLQLAPEYYNLLRKRILSQFTIGRGQDMCFTARSLGDETMVKEYEKTLLLLLPTANNSDFYNIKAIGEAYLLSKLNKEVQRMVTKKNKDAFEELANEVHEENERLTANLLATEALNKSEPGLLAFIGL